MGQRAQQKIIKALLRRGILLGRSVRCSDVKGLRKKHGVSVRDFAAWCGVSADVVTEIDSQGDAYLDGGLASQLVLRAGEYVQRVGVEPSLEEIEIELPSRTHGLVRHSEPQAEAQPDEPSLVPVPSSEPPNVEQTFIEQVQRLDLSRSDLQTTSQRALAAIDLWVKATGLKKFTLAPKAASNKIPKSVRAQLSEILEIADREILASWLLYRQVKVGAKCLLAIQRVRRGEIQANSALQDYDANGWNPSDARRGVVKDKKKAPQRKRVASGTFKTVLPKKHASAAAAEQTQAVLGALHLKLVKFEQDFANDPELVELISQVRQAMDPHYQEIKRIVLRRARKKTKKRRSNVGRKPQKGGDE